MSMRDAVVDPIGKISFSCPGKLPILIQDPVSLLTEEVHFSSLDFESDLRKQK